ncbi:YbaK/EbsC family protein [Arthrobacter sp. Sa2CUA1]|uniref:YbaK/EbsC family protein n=1 Tax=Arthrobacter gallicola TaxID=2762225 RepID=A0ABR8URF4_9MICC|nr:YbaK/EbsC family protein [Arthrobacter gallicola]MBD7995140.1 YbaK/EbsC family protein [Arthrobacter gallicola]
MDADHVRGRDRVQAAARELGLDVRIVDRPDASSLAEAAAALGISPGEIVKSLVVRRKAGEYLFVLVPGDAQISWPKLRAAAGANKLTLPPAGEAFEATGYARGTITPLGSSVSWPVFAAPAIRGKRVSMGAGEHGASLFVDGDALLDALDARVADITDPLP